MPIVARKSFELTLQSEVITENPFIDLMPRINAYYEACQKSIGKEIPDDIIKHWLLSKSRLYVDSMVANSIARNLFSASDFKCNNHSLNYFLNTAKAYHLIKTKPTVPRLFDYAKMGYNSFVNSAYWQLARQARFMKDGYKCKRCNAMLKSSRLNAHHKNYNNRGWEIENNQKDLITLCVHCHQVIHKNSSAKVNAKYFK